MTTAAPKNVMAGQLKPDSVPLSPLDAAPEREPLCIFGTGDLGRSLGQRLLQTGYRVVYGSRTPHSCGPLPLGAQVVSHTAAAQSCSLIFMCVQREHYDFIETLAPQLKGKVLVDVSNNRKKGCYTETNAQYLQRLVPGASVVKAFNTVSAWAIQNGPFDANRQVHVCGDDEEAKAVVSELATRLGFSVLDRGGLSAATELEDFPLRLFPQWQLPLYIAGGLVAFFFFYVLVIDVVYTYVTQNKDMSFRIMVSLANKVFPCVSLVMLSLCYLPGVLASFLQLHRGTKYSRFPNWLDRWMLCRKQLGLLALGFAFLHVLYTLLIPTRYYLRFKAIANAVSVIRENKTTVFDTTAAWRTDSYYSVGIMAFGLYVLLGITSLPTVSNALSWREFTFVQSKLGHVTLLLCTLHVYLYGWDKFLRPSTYRWHMPSAYMLALALPTVVLGLKGALLLPCLGRRLTRIRHGWERAVPEAERKPLIP